MDFLGIGGGEVLLILIIAVIVWGPGRVVEVARTLGKMLHTLRKVGSDLTAQVAKEIEEQERKPPSKKHGDQ